ncbi:Vacuolar protein-sorting-associated protein 24 [Orbilia ellipsospora]|uniref:Vacuolar protein-sorting-associated protein 24 n=1 Tax=Orbilia ellipsospora TaxID=2528407 RepID=A0AAV9XNR7_9PEZI
MQSIKSFIWGPDPAEQLRKCNSLIRQNSRQLDRQINDLERLENKTKATIKSASSRAANRPSASKNTQLEVRLLARELLRIRKQHTRLTTSKAQLESVGMQVREAFAVRKIQGSVKASTEVMRNVNSLIKLPQLTGTMEHLRKELLTAQIIEEMSEDMVPVEDEFEDEEAEEEVDKVISEIVGSKMANAEVPVDMPEVPVAEAPVEEANLEDIRSRLFALQN